MDISLLIDTSSSVGRSTFSQMQEFIGNVAMEFEVALHRTRIGAISFNEDATVEFDYDTYDNPRDIMDAVKVEFFLMFCFYCY